MPLLDFPKASGLNQIWLEKYFLWFVILRKMYFQSCQLLKKPWSEILSGVCHTAKPWELDAYLIISIGWPDVLFSPDMSSFRDLKNASGRDSKNVRDFASSDICVSLGLSQTSYYALTSFGKGISWLNYTTATGHAAASTDSFWFIVPQRLCVLQSNSPPGVTVFVEDDLRDAFFVGVAVVVDCLFTFSQ